MLLCVVWHYFFLEETAHVFPEYVMFIGEYSPYSDV